MGMSISGGGLLPTPWYKENPFWGGLGGFCTFVLAGIGFGKTGNMQLGRWFLSLAWPFAILSIWVMVNGLTKNPRFRIRGRIAGAIGIGAILWAVDVWVRAAAPLPYDLSGSREEQFLKLLEKPQSEPRATLRVGCVTWSERACVAAGRFLIEFSKSGWPIDSNRVFRMETQAPTDGVTICTNKPAPTNLPPHLGVWQKMNPSHVRIECALLQIGIRVGDAGDASLPTGTLGVYFGPEPSSLIHTDKTLKKVCESPSS